MSEYLRDLQDQIQADIANRISKIAMQYDGYAKDLPLEQQYDVTLHICLLQTLLTSCSELIRAMSRNMRKKSLFCMEFTDNSGLWGLRKSMVERDTFVRKQITHEDVITHIRDALSHPTIIDFNAAYTSTGYTTRRPLADEIQDFIFISSPDIRGDHPKNYSRVCEAELQLNQKGYPQGAYIKPITNVNETRYQIWHEDSPYIREFRILIPVQNLKELVRGLSSHLAQPILPTWDGETT